MTGHDALAGAEPAFRMPGLLEKLVAAVRHEFRAEILAFDPRDPVFGGPPCAVHGCDRPARSSRMCWGHRGRWAYTGRPPIDEFAATTPTIWFGHRPLAQCIIPDCRYGVRAARMCIRHLRQWKRLDCPPAEVWSLSAQPRRPPSAAPPTCRIDYCDLWVCGSSGLCTGHDTRWRARGRGDMHEFIARYQSPENSGAERIVLDKLAPHLRLEMQFVLQCRRDEAAQKIIPAVAQRIVNALAEVGTHSLLEQPEEVWRTFRARNKAHATGQGTFLVDARRRIETLAFGGGWQLEYPRDLWRLRTLGLPRSGAPNIDFTGIPQPWLRELAKRWARWRLSTGINNTTVNAGVRVVTRFAKFLPPDLDGAQHLDRALLERYLADLSTAMPSIGHHTRNIGQLNQFLRTIRLHGWDTALPGSALFVPEDYPKPAPMLPRAVAEHVMNQLENPANLDRWQDPDRRLVTVILIRCGLRVSDALGLQFDPIAHDADSAPYLRYFNHKMKREALVPIDEELLAAIREQQKRAAARQPAGAVILFPRPTANLAGDKTLSSSTYRRALDTWLADCDTRDESGRPVHLTPHQFRHTLGTRLINKDVPQEVVRRILDHSSAHMTAHYARLSDTTIRRHWEKARKVNTQGDVVQLDPDGPLADAAWSKQRLSRATQALPNGYCALPLVQTCPHANACLTCPMFLTTAEFLPQHRTQRAQTIELITAAEANGYTRQAEMNRQVADNLEKIINSLEQDSQAPGAAADAA